MESIPAGSGAGNLLDVALRLYGDYGWSVIPVVGKVAAAPWKEYQSKPATEDDLRELFALPGVTGLALVNGPASGGTVVRDFDVRAAYDDWRASHPKLKLPTASTRRGAHVYFRGPPGYHTLPDGEYRGDSLHYTVLPPSPHPGGGRYGWLRAPGAHISAVDPVALGLLPPTPPLNPPQRHGYTPGDVANPLPPPRTAGGRVVVRPLPPAVDRIVALCAPSAAGQRDGRVMDLVRHLKGLRYRWDTHSAHRAFCRWWALAEPVVRTKDPDVSWRAFLRAWGNCHTPVTRLDADELARAAYVLPAPDNLPDRVGLLLNACKVLQGWNDGQSFYLSYEDAGRVMGLSKPAGQLAMRRLCREGRLRLVERGSNHAGKASTYTVLESGQ